MNRRVRLTAWLGRSFNIRTLAPVTCIARRTKIFKLGPAAPGERNDMVHVELYASLAGGAAATKDAFEMIPRKYTIPELFGNVALL